MSSLTASKITDSATDHLSVLNPEQRNAVEVTDGPVLVLAGAGTGKTRVLTTRIAHILALRRAFPSEILAVTFTNKAAREMAERVQKLTQSSAHEPDPRGGGTVLNFLGTFHSICAKILRRHAEKLGFTSSFTILDTDDQLRLIKTLLEENNIDPKNQPPKLFGAIIQNWKDQGLTPDKVGADGHERAEGRALQIYRAYQGRLKTLNAVDFGDLLLHNLTLFAQFPDVLQEYARRFRYILVDEYQDTNVAQYLWLRLLAIGHKNICCVGDDDQSIYGWRGAEVGNILRFEKDFPGAHVVRLERNYRSSQHILSAASGLIANNSGRLGKTLWTETGGGEKVRIKSVWDGDEEASFVGEEIEAFQRGGSRLSECAILVRAGFQTRAFEERFLTLGIPYRVVGGLRFYERAEIRDAVAYLRVIEQPNDDLAFERIINTPKRGVGTATLEQMHTHARANDIALTASARILLDQGAFKGKLAATLSALLAHFERWREFSKTRPIAEVTDMVIDESGYRAMWMAEKTPDAQGRLENLKELVRAMGEFESLISFLEHVGLVTDMEQAAQGDMVNVMTLHAAKGLEFDHVFLPGWEEGVFPHQRALDEKGAGGLEEERRLAYVGITRARKNLHISFAANRRVYNQWQSNIPSRFVGELPEDHTERMEGGAFGSGGGSRAQGLSDFRSEIDSIMRSGQVKMGLQWESGYSPPVAAFNAKPAAATRENDTATAYRSSDTLGAGARVFHIKFGYGKILSTSGDTLEIAFDKAGVKKVKAGFVEKAK